MRAVRCEIGKFRFDFPTLRIKWTILFFDRVGHKTTQKWEESPLHRRKIGTLV